MYHLNISRPLETAQADAFESLENFFRAHAADGKLRLNLRAPLSVPGLRIGVTLDRDVLATVSPLGENRRAYTLAWEPAEAGPFPTFTGAVFVAHDEEQPEHSVLTLDGHYAAPLSVAGDVFDAVVGRHIAEASANDLVSRFCAFIDDPATAIAA